MLDHVVIGRGSEICFGNQTSDTLPVPPRVFTGLPDQDGSRRVARFGKAATDLESNRGVPVCGRPVRSDPAAVTAVTNGPVPRAGFGGFIGVQARRAVPGAQALAQGAEDAAFKIDRIANAATGLTPDTDVPKAIADKPSRSAPAPRPPGG